jgi:hypothetical protein
MKKVVIFVFLLLSTLFIGIISENGNVYASTHKEDIQTIDVEDDYFLGFSDDDWDYIALMYNEYINLSENIGIALEEYMLQVYADIIENNTNEAYRSAFSATPKTEEETVELLSVSTNWESSIDPIETESLIFGINISELGVCVLHPVACLIAEGDADTAVSKTLEIYGRNSADDASDAFRHAYWNALMMIAIPESVVEDIATAHESESTGLAHEMDLYNNQVGRDKYSGWELNSMPYISVTERADDLAIYISDKVRRGYTVEIVNNQLVSTTEGLVYSYPSSC